MVKKDKNNLNVHTNENPCDIIILIPHYNNHEGLVRSLQSIQESIPVDILIVDDGSIVTPNKKSLELHYSSGKILIQKLQKNRGIEHALNHGLSQIMKMDYTYIGRLDCGDKCCANRFKKQRDFLDNNKHIALVGTQVESIDYTSNKGYTSKLPLTHDNIKKAFNFNCKIVHPTVLFRKKIILEVGMYPVSYPAAEDYAFFYKILKKFEVANLDEVLLIKELNEDAISSLQRKSQVRSRIRIIWNNRNVGIRPILGVAQNSILLFLPTKLMITVKNFKERLYEAFSQSS